MIMKCMVVAAVAFCAAMAALAQEARQPGGPGILIAYFSKTNNTRTLAELIQARVGGDMFHVTTKKPYPADYRATTDAARAELDGNARPELAATISPEDMRRYDVVFLGYPSWWGTMPMAMFTFLEQYDLAGKTIVPFCTHEGSGLGRGPADIGRLSPGATVGQGFAARGGQVGGARNDVDAWLRQLGYIK